MGMREEDLKPFTKEMIDALTEKLDEKEKLMRAEQVAAQIKKTIEDGKLFPLTHEETTLLEEFREWKKLYKFGTFHFYVKGA